jgi:hypothetical protein
MAPREPEERGSVARRVEGGNGGGGLVLTGGGQCERRVRAAWHGLHGGGTGVSDEWAPVGSGRGEAWGAWAGLEKKEMWAEAEGTGTFLIYSNEF